MPTKGDITEIGFGILAIRETTQGIRKALGKEIKRDKKATKKKEGFLRRLFTKKKKAESEKLIEAKKPKNLIGKGVGAVAAAAKYAKSFRNKAVNDTMDSYNKVEDIYNAPTK